MVDTQCEQVVTFNEATRLIPGRPHLCQLYRWSMRGLGGVKLEWIQIGGKRCTSREALQRFFTALTAARSGQSLPSPTPASRARSVDAATRELEAAGFEVGGNV